MSSLCIINFKIHELNYEKFVQLSNHLIEIALKNEIGIIFNQNYWEPLITDAKMKDYCIISKDFLYRDCECVGLPSLFDLQSLIMDLCQGNSYYVDCNEFKVEFFKRYKFFKELIDCIFNYEVELIEIYVSNNGAGIIGVNDFNTVKTNSNDFLLSLFDTLTDELNNHFNYEFADIKFEILKKLI